MMMSALLRQKITKNDKISGKFQNLFRYHILVIITFLDSMENVVFTKKDFESKK